MGELSLEQEAGAVEPDPVRKAAWYVAREIARLVRRAPDQGEQESR